MASPERFQMAVLGIAVLAVIVTLGTVGYIMYHKSSSMKWPPVTGHCPDYWADVNGDGTKCVNTHKMGTCALPGGATYTAYSATTMSGGSPAKSSTESGCKETCSGDKLCRAFTFDAGTNMCSLKSTLGSKSASAQSTETLYVRDTAGPEADASMNFSASPYTGGNGTCEKYTWAKNCGITWDGITTANETPC